MPIPTLSLTVNSYYGQSCEETHIQTPPLLISPKSPLIIEEEKLPQATTSSTEDSELKELIEKLGEF